MHTKRHDAARKDGDKETHSGRSDKINTGSCHSKPGLPAHSHCRVQAAGGVEACRLMQRGCRKRPALEPQGR